MGKEKSILGNESGPAKFNNVVENFVLRIESELAEDLESPARRDEILSELKIMYLTFRHPKLQETIRDIEKRYGKKGTKE